MNRRTALLAALACLSVHSALHADYSVEDRGAWPETWPKELEPLRKQARTFEGPLVPYLHYSIPFTKREEFESAWLHLLKAKTPGAPIILVRRGQSTDFFGVKPAGVLFHAPPAGTDKTAHPQIPRPGNMDVRTKWSNATYFELVVDGEIVDLNRIPLPADCPIVDERFKEEQKPAKTSGK